jgi:GT2 family glycosyltransferase
MINEIIEISTDNLEPERADSEKIWENRQRFYSEKRKLSGNIKVTICVQAYNQIDKLRYSLECLQKFTPEDLYELILVDNGSEPEVMELYKTIIHPRVKIIRITKNISSANFPQQCFVPHIKGEYTVWLFSDIYVTKNWLENLLACMDSDKKIGIAAPLSSNDQSDQSINELNDMTKKEILEYAANFNISDPKKWNQDIRVSSLCPIIRSEIFNIVGTFDTAIYHQFADVDFCFRIRRAGYKVVMCRDTVVYHDHIRDENDREKQNDAAIIGENIFYEKWKADSWIDLLIDIPIHPQLTEAFRYFDANILCIDPKLGKPILSISNHIKSLEGSVKKTYAFTTEEKFYPDLITIADETRIGMTENIRKYYSDNSFDIICLCKALNTCAYPTELLKDMTHLLKEKGMLIFHIDNSFDIATLFECFRISSSKFTLKPNIRLTEKQCKHILTDYGYDSVEMVSELMELDNEGIDDFFKPIFKTVYHSAGIPYDDIILTPVKTSKIHFTAVKG